MSDIDSTFAVQVNYEAQCQTYLEPPYDEMFAAHIRYWNTCKF